MIIRCLILVALCYGQTVLSQSHNPLPDSLQAKSFNYIFDRIESTEISESQRLYYIEAFLSKAKAEKNYTELSEGYKNYVHFAPEHLKLKYADSMVIAAKHTADNKIIGSAYLSKGVAYYGRKKLSLALDNYLLANKYISKTKDDYLIYKAKYHIAQIKYLLGYYDEAIVLFEACIGYLKNEDNSGYLDALHSLGLCYNKAGNYGKCSEVNAKGIFECVELGQPEMKPYFELSQGVNNCSMRNYTIAIKAIKAALVEIPKDDFGNITVGNFHVGKSYWMLGNEEKAVQYFKKVDESFSRNNYIRPDLRKAYEFLITFYKSKNRVKEQLHYIETLLKVDEFLYNTFFHLQGKIAKDYDTGELKKEKNRLEQILTQRKYHEIIFIAIIVLFIILTGALYIRHRNARRVFRKRYEELLQKLETSRQVKAKDQNALDINEDAVSKVLRQLEKFESGKKFLDRDLNQSKLAALFGTNTTYLSKIIFHHRGKKFPEYINDLKIDYIAQRIKEEKVLRKYNNKALAEEAGFTTTPRFVSAFFTRTGITPTFFIEELVRDEISLH